MSVAAAGTLAAEGKLLFRSVFRPRGFWSRARGLLARPAPAEHEAWLFERCRAVHTFGMRCALDLIFLDVRGRVVQVVEALPPWKAAVCVSASHVVEARAGSGRRLGLEPGQQLQFNPVGRPQSQ